MPPGGGEIVVPIFDFFRIVNGEIKELRPYFDPKPLRNAAQSEAAAAERLPKPRDRLETFRAGLSDMLGRAVRSRIKVPSDPFTGHTMVRPARFGSVVMASSGTIIHSPSRRTR